jgi:hypothetical protein
MNKDIYRLVKPYQSTKVHESTTFMHGANKCYNELKKNNVSCNSFTIMNINDNNLYNFNINNKPKMLLEEKNDPTQLLNINQSGGDEILLLKNKIKQLEERINNLENKIKN